jgi:hypothetical protein
MLKQDGLSAMLMLSCYLSNHTALFDFLILASVSDSETPLRWLQRLSSMISPMHAHAVHACLPTGLLTRTSSLDDSSPSMDTMSQVESGQVLSYDGGLYG